MTKYTIKTAPSLSDQPNLRTTPVGAGLGTPEEIHNELQYMYDVLLDRTKIPIDYHSSLALMEVADAYYMRASEIKGRIYALERDGTIRGHRESKDPYHLLRTGEIDTFLDACKRAVETGSRRLSAQQFELEKAIRGLSAWGGGLKSDS